jgi:TPR repeat protein
MVEWGLCCETGKGVEKDFSEAGRWYKRAMDNESAHGAFCYGSLLENGKGVKRDTITALSCYKYAADNGYEAAQSKYGLILEFGTMGLQPNLAKSVKYYKMSSDQGNPQGMFYYADMLEHGKGVPIDIPQAITLYKLAAQKLHTRSVRRLALLMMEGKGVPREVEMGTDMLWRFAGQLEADGKKREAFDLYQTLSNQGYRACVLKCAECFENGIGCSKDPESSAALYQKLIDNDANDCEALVRLARLMAVGNGVKKDVKRATQLLQRAMAAEKKHRK